jgi:hypothetical protein
VHAALRVEGHRRVGVRASRADAEALEQGHPERAPRRFAPRERHRGELFVVPREDDALDAIGAAKQRRERRRLGALRRLVDDERVELERAERIGPGRRERTRDDGRAAEERDALARLGRFGRRRKEKTAGTVPVDPIGSPPPPPRAYPRRFASTRASREYGVTAAEISPGAPTRTISPGAMPTTSPSAARRPFARRAHSSSVAACDGAHARILGAGAHSRSAETAPTSALVFPVPGGPCTIATPAHSRTVVAEGEVASFFFFFFFFIPSRSSFLFFFFFFASPRRRSSSSAPGRTHRAIRARLRVVEPPGPPPPPDRVRDLARVARRLADVKREPRGLVRRPGEVRPARHRARPRGRRSARRKTARTSKAAPGAARLSSGGALCAASNARLCVTSECPARMRTATPPRAS